MMRRTIFSPEHDAFRSVARSFFEKECAPNTSEWERVGIVDREVWRKAGKAGLLDWEAPEQYGGAGIRDYRYNAIMSCGRSSAAVSPWPHRQLFSHVE